MDFLLKAFLFFLPAGIANMTPIFAARLPLLRGWNTPLDFGARFQGKRIFGANKTWRGLISGTVMGGLTSLSVETFVAPSTTQPGYVLLAGCLMGFGALFGDAAESFLKRRRGIPPGRSWFPFDQIDYVIGGLLFVDPLTLLPVLLMTVIVIIYVGLHLLASYIGYLMGLKPRPI